MNVQPAEMEAVMAVAEPKRPWHEGLPRTINPATGKDDTKAKIEQCEAAFPRFSTPDDHLDINRRKLYLAIIMLRTKTRNGYHLDKFNPKTGYTSALTLATNGGMAA